MSAAGVQESGTALIPLLDDDGAALFPKLTAWQDEVLAELGEGRRITEGEVLTWPKDPGYDARVVPEGSVPVEVGFGASVREFVRQDWRDLMVELNTFSGQGSEANGVVREPTIDAGRSASWSAAIWPVATSCCRRGSPPASRLTAGRAARRRTVLEAHSTNRRVN
jgi:hypothetical protein